MDSLGTLMPLLPDSERNDCDGFQARSGHGSQFRPSLQYLGENCPVEEGLSEYDSKHDIGSALLAGSALGGVGRLQRATQLLQQANADQSALQNQYLPLGIQTIDHCLGGGLLRHGLHEVRCGFARNMGEGIGFVLGLLSQFGQGGNFLWIVDRACRLDGGVLFPGGVAQYGLNPQRIHMVLPGSIHDALWAADEAASSKGIDGIILQIKGNPSRLDITASKRLAHRAQRHKTFICLLRQSGEAEASAALSRWHIMPLPTRNPDRLQKARQWRGFHQFIGPARQRLILEKNRNGPLGEWSVEWNPRARTFSHVAKPQTRFQVKRPPTPIGQHPRNQGQSGFTHTSIYTKQATG